MTLEEAVAASAGSCKACGAPLTWAIHAGTGGRMPLEPAPEAGARGGTFALELVAGTLTYHAGASPAAATRYVSHFATCPQAGSFRRQRVAGYERTVRVPAARRTDPPTSSAAAASAAPAAQSIRELVARGIRQAGPAGVTDEELLRIFKREGWAGSDSGIRSRRAELVAAGELVDSGTTRKTRHGRASVVWVVTR